MSQSKRYVLWRLILCAAALLLAQGAHGEPGVVRDDGGNRNRTANNTQAPVDLGVPAFTRFGAASFEAALPAMEKSAALLIGAASGAEFMRDPPNRMLLNRRTGAREEAAAMMLHLDTAGLTEIAAISQDDPLGKAALEGMQAERSRLGIPPQALVRLAVQSSGVDVAHAVQAACKGSSTALLVGLNATNVLAVIRAARDAGAVPTVYAMSEVGSELLAGVPSSRRGGLPGGIPTG